MSSLGDYQLCHWRVRSEIDLPELPLWTGDDRAPDVVVALGDAPDFDNPIFKTPVLQIQDGDRIRFGIDGVADYLVEEGRRITVAPKLAAGSPDVRLFLLGMGLGVLCHQRGVLPIHASAVVVDGRAILFAGASGIGKSTLAAAFLRRGHTILSDDIAPLTRHAGTLAVLPSLRRIRLWRDSARQSKWDIDSLEPCREGMEKYSYPLDAQHSLKPIPPAALIHLSFPVNDEPAFKLERLRGHEAVKAMRQQVYRWRTLAGSLGPIGAWSRVSDMAGDIPCHMSLQRPMKFAELDATVDAVLDAVRVDA